MLNFQYFSNYCKTFAGNYFSKFFSKFFYKFTKFHNLTFKMTFYLIFFQLQKLTKYMMQIKINIFLYQWCNFLLDGCILIIFALHFVHILDSLYAKHSIKTFPSSFYFYYFYYFQVSSCWKTILLFSMEQKQINIFVFVHCNYL